MSWTTKIWTTCTSVAPTGDYAADLEAAEAAVERALAMSETKSPGHLTAQVEAEMRCMAFVMQHRTALRAFTQS